MIGLLALLILSLIFVALVVFIYYLIYSHIVNKRIREGKIDGKKLVDIPKLVMCGIIASLLIYCVIVRWSLYDAQKASEIPPSRNSFAVIDVSDPDDYHYSFYSGYGLDDASFAKMYSKDDNPGYEKEVIEKDSVVFTVFKRTSAPDSFHPDFLCFVDYSPVNNAKFDGAQILNCTISIFNTSNDEYIGGFSFEYDINDNINELYIGYLDTDNIMSISYSTLDTESSIKYENDMNKSCSENWKDVPNIKDYSLSTHSVDILIY